MESSGSFSYRSVSTINENNFLPTHRKTLREKTSTVVSKVVFKRFVFDALRTANYERNAVFLGLLTDLITCISVYRRRFLSLLSRIVFVVKSMLYVLCGFRRVFERANIKNMLPRVNVAERLNRPRFEIKSINVNKN